IGTTLDWYQYQAAIKPVPRDNRASTIAICLIFFPPGKTAVKTTYNTSARYRTFGASCRDTLFWIDRAGAPLARALTNKKAPSRALSRTRIMAQAASQGATC